MWCLSNKSPFVQYDHHEGAIYHQWSSVSLSAEIFQVDATLSEVKQAHCRICQYNLVGIE